MPECETHVPNGIFGTGTGPNDQESGIIGKRTINLQLSTILGRIRDCNGLVYSVSSQVFTGATLQHGGQLQIRKPRRVQTTSGVVGVPAGRLDRL